MKRTAVVFQVETFHFKTIDAAPGPTRNTLFVRTVWPPIGLACVSLCVCDRIDRRPEFQLRAAFVRQIVLEAKGCKR